MAAIPNYDIILQQLQKMDAKIDSLAEEIHKANISITRIDGMKHALQDIKTWKENVENAVNAVDLKKMKDALSNVIKNNEDIENVERDIAILRKEKDDDKKEIDKLNTFKTQVITYGTIVGFIFTTALVVLGWFLS